VQSWFAANARYRPWCFVQPYTTQEVSVIIRTLANAGKGAGDWHIAVRSGGHSPAGTNNIANGVTIDLGMMNSSYYNSQQKLASVEPGGHWKDVYRNLLQNGNVTVTGGRDGGVGVGGFLLGGGLSYYTPRNGLGCDTVINYEVVLANGSVVNANSNSHPDLYKALKGGSLNFGIVTRFDVQAMPAVDIAYGQSIFTSNHSGAVFDALSLFVETMNEEGDDALFALHIYDPKGNANVLVVRTNVQGDLDTASFDNITAIPALTSTWERKSMADAAEDSQISAGSKYVRYTLVLLYSFRLFTFANDYVRSLGTHKQH
jgi:FAD/FMN-containing dehydrogenase